MIIATNCENGQVEFKSSDARTVINNAILTLANGGEVYIDPGTYVLSNPIILRSNLLLSGDGDSTILIPPNSEHAIKVVLGGANNVIVQNLKILGSHNSFNGIRFQDVHIGKITNCTIENMGGWAINIYTSDNIEVTNNIIIGSKIWEDGVHITSSQNVFISDNNIDSGDDSIVATIDEGNKENIEDILVTNNILRSVHSNGFKLTIENGRTRDIKNVSFISNRIETAGEFGIYIKVKEGGIGSIMDIKIADVFYNASQNTTHGCVIEGVNGIIVENLEIYNSAKRGITIGNSQNVKLSDIIIKGTGRIISSHGMLIGEPNKPVTNCELKNIEISESKSHGIEINSSSTIYLYDISSHHNSANGLQVRDSEDIIVLDCYLANNEIGGLNEVGTSDYNTFRNINLIDQAKNKIKIVGEHTITENILLTPSPSTTTLPPNIGTPTTEPPITTPPPSTFQDSYLLTILILLK